MEIVYYNIMIPFFSTFGKSPPFFSEVKMSFSNSVFVLNEEDAIYLTLSDMNSVFHSFWDIYSLR